MDLLFSLNSLSSPSFFPLLLLSFFYYRHHQKNPSQNNGLKPYPLLGTLPHFIRNQHRLLKWTAEILIAGPTHTITIKSPTSAHGVITSDPRNVEHMLKTNFGNYPRGDHTITLVHDLLGHSIFNSEGDHWKDQRKTASFEFNKRSFRNFVVHTVRLEIVDRLLPLMYKYAEAKETLELQGVLERFGFDNVCRLAFGVDPGCLSTEVAAEGLEFMRLIGDAQNLIAARFMGVFGFTWKMKKLINIGPEKRLKESIKIVQDFAMNIIKTKKAKLEENQEEVIEEDLLS